MTEQPERMVLVRGSNRYPRFTKYEYADAFDDALRQIVVEVEHRNPSCGPMEILEVQVIHRATVRTEVKVDEGE